MKKNIAMRYQSIINMAERLYEESNETKLYDSCIKEAEESYDNNKQEIDKEDIFNIIKRIMDYIFVISIFSGASCGSLLIISLLLFPFSLPMIVIYAILGLAIGIPLSYYVLETCDSSLFGI